MTNGIGETIVVAAILVACAAWLAVGFARYLRERESGAPLVEPLPESPYQSPPFRVVERYNPRAQVGAVVDDPPIDWPMP